jgi:lipopolysaccharide/colanic/teichoic acid biosynthesis glycosyltransferase
MAVEEIELSIASAPEPHRGYDAGKRMLDILGALVLLSLTFPVMIVAAFAILATSGRPVLFRQRRLGLGGRVFLCLKFRTMVRDAEAKRVEVLHMNIVDGPAFKLLDDPRLTKVGKWLRKTSIDELPQAFNILRGDMSLVGPRPLPIIENCYIGEQALRLSVKPGLTCIWQTSGRSKVTFDEWMSMDLEYVRCRSWLMDLQLLIRTVPVVLSARGAF